jgi:hypothetical protein
MRYRFTEEEPLSLREFENARFPVPSGSPVRVPEKKQISFVIIGQQLVGQLPQAFKKPICPASTKGIRFLATKEHKRRGNEN